MVRRRVVVGGLANHITSKAYHDFQQQQMAQLNTGWLGWPQQPIRRDAIVSNMCSKMAGSLPRMPKLQQPEPSSRNLGRLRRDLMNISPLPFTNSAPKTSPLEAQPEFGAALPVWYNYANGQMVRDPTRRSTNRAMETISNISVQLKQQLQELNEQYQEQQKQHQLRQKKRQLKLHQQQLRLHQQLLHEQQQQRLNQPKQQQPQQQEQQQKLDKFLPFNFGICAGSLINSLRDPPANREPPEEQFSYGDIFVCEKQQANHQCKAQQLSRAKSAESQGVSVSSSASLTCFAARPKRSKVKGRRREQTASRSAMESERPLETTSPSVASLHLPEESDVQVANLEPRKSGETLLESTSGYCTRQNSAANLARPGNSGLATLGSRSLTRPTLATLREVALKAGNKNLERQLKLTLDQFEQLHQLIQQELGAKGDGDSQLQYDYAAPAWSPMLRAAQPSTGEAERLEAGIAGASYSGQGEEVLSRMAPKEPKPMVRRRPQWKTATLKTLVPVDPAAPTAADPSHKHSKRSHSVKVVSCIELSSRRPLQWPVPRYLSGWAQLLPPLEKKGEKKKKHLTVTHHCRRRRNQPVTIDRIPSEKGPSIHRSRNGCRCRMNGMLGTLPLACNYYRSRYR